MAPIMVLALAAAVGGRLEGELASLRAGIGPAQAGQVSAAITASPKLQAQMERMAADGRLTGIALRPMSEVRKLGPFDAAADHGVMVLTGELLAQLANAHLYDMVAPGEVFPNNTTFVLAHLAYHVAHPLVAPQASGPDATASRRAYIKARLRDEAGAYVQAWNDTVDGARLASPNGRVSPPQVSEIMLNLRYRFVFVKALRGPQAMLRLSPSGDIAPSDQNLEAIAIALSASPIADLQ